MVSIARAPRVRAHCSGPGRARTRERLSFQSQWSGVREVVARERLYIAERRLAARRDMASRYGDAHGAVAGPNPAYCISIDSNGRPECWSRHWLSCPSDCCSRSSFRCCKGWFRSGEGYPRLAFRTLKCMCETARAGGCYRALLDEDEELGAMLDQVPSMEMDDAVPFQ